MTVGICLCGAPMTQLSPPRVWMCNNPACDFVGLEQVSICYRPAPQQDEQVQK